MAALTAPAPGLKTSRSLTSILLRRSPSGSPFADPGRSPPKPVLQQAKSNSTMRRALEESVTIRPVKQNTLDAYGQDDDILASYADPGTTSKPAPPKERSSRSKPDITQDKGSARKKDAGVKGRKSDTPFDIIDKLDISGLYGGGSFHRHDGPYAAATAARNKGPRAPMAAFDPSALAPPTATRQPRSNGSLSARAQATLAAMDSNGLPQTGDHPGMARSMSDSSVSMGFPSAAAKGKGAQLIEIYGVRDSEAWEDFGTTRFDPVQGTDSYGSSRESVVPSGTSKEDRMGRAQSIWDIEATLREGKPVGQAPPPPVPVLPSEFTNSSPEKPKRSKTIADRFRQGRRNPNTPMDDGGDFSESDGRARGEEPTALPLQDLQISNEQNYSTLSEVPQSGSAAEGEGDYFDKVSSSPTRGTGPPQSPSARFNGGSAMSGVHSNIQEGETERSALGRRPSVMQRLLGKKK